MLTRAAFLFRTPRPARATLLSGGSLGGLFVAFIGATALAGWLTRSHALSAVGATWIPMAPTSAAIFLLLGTSRLTIAAENKRLRAFALATVAASFLVAAAHVAGFVTGIDVDFDRRLFSLISDRFGLEPVGQMSFFTSLSFALASAAILVSSAPKRLRLAGDLSVPFAFMATLTGLVFALGYLYHAPLLYGSGLIPMALPSSVAFVVLGLSVALPALRRARMEQHRRDRDRAYIDGAFEHSALGMALVAPDGRWLRVNRAMCDLLGYPEPELLGQHFQAITHPDDVDANVDALRKMLRGDAPTHQGEKRYIHRDGRVVWVLVSVGLVRDADGAPRHFVVQAQNITERKRAEAELLRQAVVFETIGDAVFVMDLDGRIITSNPAATRVFGYTQAELAGRHVGMVHDPELGGRLEETIQEALRREHRWSGELPFRRKDGRRGVADVVVVAQLDGEGRPIAWIGVNRDITERMQLENRLRQSQRLEAVGQLAGGVAHDFNNLLMVISSYAAMLLEDLDAADPRRVDIREIAKAAHRAAALTQQLLAFGRRQLLQPRTLDLNHTVRELESMLRRLLAADIALRTVLEPAPWPVHADAGQIDQVLMNLVINARDAMPDGGTIQLETANVEIGAATEERHAALDVPPGAYVRLAVSDTGSGIDAATMAHIFEPFFTTKEAGKGTGLGLATVYGIVTQSGGHIRCTSEPGLGTTFEIYLPRADGAPAVAFDPLAIATPRSFPPPS